MQRLEDSGAVRPLTGLPTGFYSRILNYKDDITSNLNPSAPELFFF